jgi:hypothetical protein
MADMWEVMNGDGPFARDGAPEPRITARNGDDALVELETH